MKKIVLIGLLLYGSIASAQSNAELIIKNKIDHISALAREPIISEHPNGTLFVAGYRNAGDSPQLWKSLDVGKNWEKVDVGTIAEGAIGNSDVDLFIDSKGNIYFVSMTFTKLPEKMEGFDFSTMKGERITVGVSRDNGNSWQWQDISANDYDDRPWITETTDGALHIIWNDGKGVHHVSSNDQGENWAKRSDIMDKGGSSFMASGPNGQLAVRVAPLSASASKIDKDVDLIRLSLDNGKAWKSIKIPGNRTWAKDLSGIPRWVEPMAWDKDGRLYTLWSEGTKMKLGITADNGISWTEHVIAQNKDTLYYPYLKMSDKGLLCTYVSGFGDDVRHHAAFLNVSGKSIETYAIEPKKLDIWSRFTGEKYQRSTGGEYYPIIPLSNGNFGMVTTIQNSAMERTGFTWWELQFNKF